MLDKTEEFINKVINDKLFLLNSVHRQSTIMTIKEENIAQHTFFVAYYALKISKMLNLSKDHQAKISVKALVHDIPEAISSDIPSNIKHRVKNLKETLDELEETTINEYFSEIKDEFDSLKTSEKEQDIDGIIIKLADVISLVQFLQNEIILGNESDSLKSAIARAKNQATNKLKELSKMKGREKCD